MVLITARDTACAHNLLPLEEASHQSIIIKKCLLRNQVIALMTLKQLSLAQRNRLFLPQQENKFTFTNNTKDAIRENISGLLLRKTKK